MQKQIGEVNENSIIENQNYNSATGYRIDYNNDGQEDILLMLDEGSGHYIYEYKLKGIGKDKYEIDVTSQLGMEGFNSTHILNYEGLNYILNSGYSIVDSLVNDLTYITIDNNNKEQIKTKQLANYLMGYEIKQSWSKDGYNEIIEHMKSNLHVANMSSICTMGSAENNVQVIATDFLGDAYIVEADYNNDNKLDKIRKSIGYLSSREMYAIGSEENNQELEQLINNIAFEEGSVETIFLDKTIYGNILIIANGENDRIQCLRAFKITELGAELIGRIDLETINFIKVGDYKQN